MAPTRHRSGLLLAAQGAVLAVVLVLGAVSASARPDSRLPELLRAPTGPVVVAHRGGAAEGPENTLPAYETALEGGARVVEGDLRITADGRIVLMHDSTVDRTTDGRGPVGRLSLAELRALDAGSWFAPAFAGTRVPTLEELLELLGRYDAAVILELKGPWTPGQVAGLREELRRRGMEGRAVIASFSVVAVRAALAAAPEIPRMLLCKGLGQATAEMAGLLDVVAVGTNPDAASGLPAAVGELRAAGFGVLLYTLNSTRQWEEAAEDGVDGIISDRPAAVAAWMAGGGP